MCTYIGFDGPASASGLGSLARARLAAAGCSPTAREGEMRQIQAGRGAARLPGGQGGEGRKREGGFPSHVSP